MSISYKSYTIEVKAHAYDGGFTALVLTGTKLLSAAAGASEAAAIAAAKTLIDALVEDYSPFPFDLSDHLVVESNEAGTAERNVLTLTNDGRPNILFNNTAATVDWVVTANNDDRFFVSRTGSGGVELAIGTTGDTVIRGDLTVDDGLANSPKLSGGAASNPVELEATGSDTNVDVKITPKGSGKVRFGAIVNPSKEIATDRYIEIKAADGTTFYLLGTETDPSA